MKTKTFIALAAGLIGFVDTANGATTTTIINSILNKFSVVDFQISQNSVTGANPGEGLTIGGYNANDYQQGYYFTGGMKFVQDGEEYYDGYMNFYYMSSALLQVGSTVDASTSFKGSSVDYNTGNPFTGTIYQGFRAEVDGNTYYGYIQGTGNGGTTWTLDSISFNSTPGASVTIVDTTAAIPEPSAMALLGLGAMGLFARRRRN